MSHAPKLEHLFTLSELVAAGYGSRAKLMLAIKDGRLPAVKIGRLIKVYESDVSKLMEPVPYGPSAEIPATARVVLS